MARRITIEVTGQSGQYEAMIRRITEQNEKLYGGAQRGAAQTAASFRVLQQGLSGLQAAIGATFSIGAIVAFGKSVIDVYGRIQDLSERTGISARTLAGLRTTLEQSGVSLDSFARGIQIAQRNLAEVDDKGSAASRALKAMGLEVKDLIRLSPDQFLEQFVNALSKVDNQNQRSAIAFAVLGRAGGELAPVIANLAGNFEELRKSSLSEEDIANIDRVGDSFLAMWHKIQAFAASEILAVLRDFQFMWETIKGLRDDLDRARVGGAAGILSQPGVALPKQRGALLDLSDKQEKAGEAARKKAQQEAEAAKKAAEAFTESIRKQTEQVSLQIIAITDSQAAVDGWKIALLEGEAADKKLNGTQRESIRTLSEQLGILRELKREEIERKELAEGIAARAAELEQQQERENELLRDELNIKTRLAAIEGAQQIEKMQVAGASDRDIVAKRLELLKAQEAQLRNAPQLTREQNEQQQQLLRQIDIEETRLQQFGKVTVDIGKAIADTLASIAHGLASGTLKGFDVIKAAGAAALNFITDIFRQTLAQKLSFEVTLLTNMRGLPGQMQGALGAGAAGMPGGGGGIFGGIGDWFSGLFGGGSAGQIGPLMQNGAFFSNSGSAGGGSLFGGLLGAALGIGGGIMSIMNAFQGSVAKGVGSVLGGGIGAIFGPIGFGIGSLLGSLIGGLFGSTPNPTAIVGARFGGITTDPLTGRLIAGGVRGSVSTSGGLGSGQGQAVKNQVQESLDSYMKTWIDILNIFPTWATEKMQPQLDAGIARLNRVFARIKFSEGGSRTIDQEMRDFLSGRAATGTFGSLRGAFGVGFAETLGQAGFGDLSSLIGQTFAPLPASGIPDPRFKGLKLIAPTGKKNIEPFIAAMRDLVGITSGFANISPTGVQPFLGDTDRELIKRELEAVFSITKGKQFAPGVAALKQNLDPILQFLQTSVQQSTDIFGRGLIAAMEAASESSAQRAFIESLGEGTKEIIFKGITEAFIASAQFNDLLAPIQKTIREFTSKALETGELPDLEAFRRAILPNIEQISTRASTLAPLIAEFNKLAEVIRQAVSGMTTGVTGNDITINLQGVNDPEDMLRRLMDLLGGQIAPRV